MLDGSVGCDRFNVMYSLLQQHKNSFTALKIPSAQFSSVWLLSRVRLFATPWIAARQASLSITISQSSLRLTSIESVMPSSHLILCRPLFLLPPVPPSIRVFSNDKNLLHFTFSYFSSQTPGNRWSFHCLYGFISSKMSYAWNRIVCSLLRLAFFT